MSRRFRHRFSRKYSRTHDAERTIRERNNTLWELILDARKRATTDRRFSLSRYLLALMHAESDPQLRPALAHLAAQCAAAPDG